MNNKFKVGGKIKYLNYNSEYYIDEVDREQIIVIISNYNFHEYKNGIPVIWEDEVFC